MVVLNSVFVPDDLTVEFIDQLIYCCVQVRVGTFGKQIAAFNVDIAFGALPSFFFLLVFH